MDIEEVRKKKSELERNVVDMINDFRERTTIPIKHFDVLIAETTTFGDKQQEFRAVNAYADLAL